MAWVARVLEALLVPPRWLFTAPLLVEGKKKEKEGGKDKQTLQAAAGGGNHLSSVVLIEPISGSP